MSALPPARQGPADRWFATCAKSLFVRFAVEIPDYPRALACCDECMYWKSTIDGANIATLRAPELACC